MNRDPIQLPTTRSWRDIPQPVVPRVMSAEGRWRLVKAVFRVLAIVLIGVLLAWGVWLVVASLREDARRMPAAAKSVPMKKPELRTDGVLDDAWLARTLALPKDASLTDLKLEVLRERLLADPQVLNASVTRRFPDRLLVTVSERTPVARVMTESGGQQRPMLVARDGVIYAGSGYDASVLESLLWLDGVKIASEGGRLQPIAGMSVVADLLGRARLEVEHLYLTWDVISMARLESDRKLEIRSKTDAQGNGRRVVYFSTADDFFRQLVKLNYISDELAAYPGWGATVDLSLGQDVPVSLVPPIESVPATTSPDARVAAPSSPAASAVSPARSAQALFVLPSPPPKKSNREL